MNLVNRDIDTGTKTEEAEERNAREAKMVEATDFHSVGAGSNPVASTKNNCMRKENFNIDWTTNVIAGRSYSRLSLQ
jgi:hypothetical protein